MGILPIQLHAEEPVIQHDANSSAQNQDFENEENRASINFKIKPIGVLLGIAGLEIQTKLHPHFSFGFGAEYLSSQVRNIERESIQYAGILHFCITHECMTDGWFFEPALRFLKFVHPTNANRDQAGFHGSADGGYQWFWKSGFNTHLGLGIAVGAEDRSRALEPFLLWQVGYAL